MPALRLFLLLPSLLGLLWASQTNALSMVKHPVRTQSSWQNPGPDDPLQLPDWRVHARTVPATQSRSGPTAAQGVQSSEAPTDSSATRTTR